MILASSAVVSIVRREHGHADLVEAIEAAPEVAIGTGTLPETSALLVGHFGVLGRAILARFLEENRVVEIPFSADHWRLASEASIRFGEGRHPADLDPVECMTYATAQLAGEPLLFVGDGFARTDVVAAV